MKLDPEEAELSLRLVDALASFSPAYGKWVRSRLPAGGPTYARMRLMEVLRRKGPQIMSSVSDELGVTRRNVTALVDALEGEGLVRRRPHPEDRRATIIELTSRGREVCLSLSAEHAAAVSELFSDLTGEDRRELARLLGILRASLRRRGMA